MQLVALGAFAPGLGRVTFAGPPAWVGSSSQAGLFDLIVTASLAALLLAFFLRRLLEDLRWVKAA